MNVFARIVGIVLTVCVLPLSAASASIIFKANMSGANETVPNVSTATGVAWVTLHDDMNTLDVSMTFSGLSAPATASHIHCCALPGVNAPVRLDFGGAAGFPTGVMSGSYDRTFLLSSITLNGGMTTAAFITGLTSGLAYTNIHNTLFPGGEIRGQLVAVPEPASLAAFGLGLIGFAFASRRQSSTRK